MTLGDAGTVVAIGALTLGVINAFIAARLRKHGTDAAFLKRYEALEGEVTILKLRLQPLFTVMDQRLAMMFHQPEATAWAADQLIERYHANPDDLTLEELEVLHAYITRWYERTQPRATEENLTYAMLAAVESALVEGRWQVTRFERQYRLIPPKTPLPDPWYWRLYACMTRRRG